MGKSNNVKRLVFTSAEVKNGLAEHKHSKRVIVNPQPPYCYMTKAGLMVSDNPIEVSGGLVLTSQGEVIRPAYSVGDIVYIGEQWCSTYSDTTYAYKADYLVQTSPSNSNVVDVSTNMMKWNPAITMPKRAARLWYTVAGVRVERLQQITDGDAKKEGANFIDGKPVGIIEKFRHSAVDRYRHNWNIQHKSKMETQGWDADPWVYVLDLVRCDPVK